MGLFNTVVVSGKANVGKTTSLKMLAEYYNSRKDVIMEDPENLSKQDYWCSFIINNRRVAIITFGDKADDIKRAFHYLGKCDFYICASHLYGETVKAILKLKNEYNIVNPLFINKTGVSSNNETIIKNNNEVFVKQLILILDSILEASRDNW